MPGFYVNELMVRLIAREDAHPALFDDYLATLGLLARQSAAQSEQPGQAIGSREMTEPILRRFECNLLREMGYAPNFDRETRSGKSVVPDRMYEISPASGVAQTSDTDAGFHGSTLLALAMCGESIEQAVVALENPQVAAESKRLLRLLLGRHLGEEGLSSRQVMRDLVRI